MPNKLKRHECFASDNDWIHNKYHFVGCILKQVFEDEVKKLIKKKNWKTMEELDKLVNDALLEFYDTEQLVTKYYEQFYDFDEEDSEEDCD